MTFSVGSVPYVNAYPLVHSLEQPDSPILLKYAVPSHLPLLLDEGEVDAVLVSIVDTFRHPNRRIAEGICIGSSGPVKSVRLFSRVPLDQIRRLALDASSMTSNALAQIVLDNVYGTTPEVVTMTPDLENMLAHADACVLIGDIGMTAQGNDLIQLDLGQAWTEWTGLPFVWAAWVGNSRLTPPLVTLLQQAANAYPVGKGTPPDETLLPLIDYTVQRSGWTEHAVRDYFQNVMVYKMGERELIAIEEFRQRLLAHGHAWATHQPTIVFGG